MSASGHLGGQIFEATCNCNFAHNYPCAIGPRPGVAYQIDSKTLVRGGVGVVYGANTAQTGSTTNSASTTTPAFGQTVAQLQNGMPSSGANPVADFLCGCRSGPGSRRDPTRRLDARPQR